MDKTTSLPPSAPPGTATAAPQPPRKPEPHECCGTGCIPCVMDNYEEELWQFEKDLKAWEAAQVLPASAN
jgi:hypothetical protein